MTGSLFGAKRLKVDSALEFLHELVGAVPCYHYAFEPNEAAVERILEFRD
jgi:hypothetical protein